MDSETEGSAWVRRIQSPSEHEFLLKQAMPGMLRRARFQLRQGYSSVQCTVIVQSRSAVVCLTFCSFRVNKLQTGLVGTSYASDNSKANHVAKHSTRWIQRPLISFFPPIFLFFPQLVAFFQTLVTFPIFYD